MIRWEEWEPQKEMAEWWKRRLCRNRKPESWYISEEIIPFSDIIRIENRYDGTLYYGEEDLDAKKTHIFDTDKKIYPNDPCPCGSGKKYKKCCGRNGV